MIHICKDKNGQGECKIYKEMGKWILPGCVTYIPLTEFQVITAMNTQN